tara:strand:+ start:1140 stop:3326 length:2187 start_codon:yes stop_codon:yes gene_type:complete
MVKIIVIFCLILGAFSINAQQKVSDSLYGQLISLEEISVSGLRASGEIPITFSEVTAKELSTRNLGQDLPILLNFLPSVVTTSDAGSGIGYTGIRIRGIDATRVNVTINGIPYNDAESQGTFWVNLPDLTSSIESIQLQRGVGTSTNGSSAFGASINILTDGISEKRFTKISKSFGSFGSQKTTVKHSTGIINDHFEFSGRYSKIKSDGYIDRASSDLKSYFFQGVYTNKNTLLKAIIFGGSEITYQSWYGVDKSILKSNRTYNSAGEIYDSNLNLLGYYDNQVDDYKQDHYQFHWNEKISSKINFSLGVNYTYGRGFYEEYNNNQTLESLQLNQINIGSITVNKTDNITQKWLDNNYYVGTFSLQYYSDNTDIVIGGSYGKYIGDHYGNLIWAKFSSNALPNHKFYKNQGKKNDATVYWKINQDVNDRLSIFGDVQYRKIKYDIEGVVNGPKRISVNDTFSFFNPKIGLNYKANNSRLFYISYAKAHREPNRTDYENGTPKSEKLDDYEAGIRIKKSKIQSQVNLYYMNYKDQLVLTGQIDQVGSPIRKNIGNSYRFGLELESFIEINSKFSWSPNFSLSKNKNKNFSFKLDGEIKNLGETNISYSPSLVAGNSIVFSPNSFFSLGILSKYVGEQFMGNIDSNLSKLDSYFINDFRVNYSVISKKWFKEIQLSLLVNNVLNKKYTSNGYFYTYDDTWSNPQAIKTIEGASYYPQAGINFLIGTNINF